MVTLQRGVTGRGTSRASGDWPGFLSSSGCQRHGGVLFVMITELST